MSLKDSTGGSACCAWRGLLLLYLQFMMNDVEGRPREWLLTWARSDTSVPEMFHPLADEYSDIEAREARVSIFPGTPVLIDPEGRCDIALSRFFRSPHFSRLRPSTKKSYAHDLRMWIEYLDSRSKLWSDADADDVSVYWLWRTRLDLNPGAVGGSKANRELAALALLYRWACHPSRAYVKNSPIERELIYYEDIGHVDARVVRSTNVVRERVKWLTPRTFRLWRDIGLRGFLLSGLHDDSFRGRTGLRNTAMVQLLYGSGLRVQEAGSLLVPEVPPPNSVGLFNEGHLPAAIAKGGRGRTFYVMDDAVDAVNSYINTTRRAAIRRAQSDGRYDNLLTIDVTDLRSTTGSLSLQYDGKWHSHDHVSVTQRQAMFISTEHGREPLWLWLNEVGIPMPKETWTDVFKTANLRVAKAFEEGRGNGIIDRNASTPQLSPHSLRHSFALFMLIALHRSIDGRLGSDSVTDYDEERYRSAWETVRDLLGHRSITTTQQIYLSPLNGIRLQSLISGEDLETALRELSQLDSRIVDIKPGQ